MRISIRWAMVLGCLGLIWGMQILITSSTYISSQRMLAGHARDVMQNIAVLTMIQSKNHLQLAQGAALLTKRLLASEVVGSDNQQHDVLERYFLNQLSLYAHFAGIYIGMPNGDFFYVNRSDAHTPGGFRTKVIDHLNGDKKIRFIWRNSDGNIVKTSEDPSDTYDPRQRPWYQKALAERAIIWTDPYIFFSSQKPGIINVSPSSLTEVFSDIKGFISFLSPTFMILFPSSAIPPEIVSSDVPVKIALLYNTISASAKCIPF